MTPNVANGKHIDIFQKEIKNNVTKKNKSNRK